MPGAKDRIDFPDWVPLDAREACDSFYSIFHPEREQRYMLQRLATRDAMREAWAQLKHFNSVVPSILVTRIFLTWLSAMRKQPIGRTPRSGPSPAEIAA